MSRLQANFLLLVAALIWGLGNIAHKTILDHLDPVAVVGLSCLIGGMIMLPFVRRERLASAPKGWGSSLLRVSGFFAISVTMQQIAYVGASVTNASFLISTYMVMTPLVGWLMLRQRPGSGVVPAALLALAGSFLMSGGFAGIITRADLISLATAVCFSVWTVDLGRHMHAYGKPFITATAQFLLTAVLILPFSAFHGDLPLDGIVAAWPELVILGVFSTAVAFGLQTAAQRYTSASRAAIITSAEAIFAALAAAAYLGERLDMAATSGACLVFVAVMLVSTSSGKPAKTAPVGIP